MRIRFRRLKNMTLLIATGLLATLAVTVPASPASAGPIGSCASLKTFTLTFRTGGDDLRGNSEVIPFLVTTSGNLELQHVWGGFGGNTTNIRTVTFFNPNWAVSSCSITGAKLQMISHPEWYETADNWNLDGYTIQGYSATGAYKYVDSYTGTPLLKRFTGSDPWWPAP